MAWKLYSDEDALKVLREIDIHLYGGLDVSRGLPPGGNIGQNLLLLAQEI